MSIVPMKKFKKAAFTLIEMLVVILIIVILAAIAYPALNRVRESGRIVKCASNLHQLQLAAMNYASSVGAIPAAVSSLGGPDLDGKYFENKGWVAWKPWTSSSTPGTYDQQGNPGTYCVTNGTLYEYTKGLDIYMCPTFKMKYPAYKRGYSMNGAASGASMLGGNLATLVLFGDDGLCNSSTADSVFATNEVAKIHGGAKNKGHVVYLDGHVEIW